MLNDLGDAPAVPEASHNRCHNQSQGCPYRWRCCSKRHRVRWRPRRDGPNAAERLPQRHGLQPPTCQKSWARHRYHCHHQGLEYPGQRRWCSPHPVLTHSGLSRRCGVSGVPVPSKKIGVPPAAENGSRSGGMTPNAGVHAVEGGADGLRTGGIGMPIQRTARGGIFTSREPRRRCRYTSATWVAGRAG